MAMMDRSPLRDRRMCWLVAMMTFTVMSSHLASLAKAESATDSVLSGQSPFLADGAVSTGSGQPAQYAQYYEDAEETAAPGEAAPPPATGHAPLTIDGKRCCPPCGPGYGTGGYGPGTSATDGSTGTGSSSGDVTGNTNLGNLSPRQFAALDPEVNGAAFGGGGYLDLPFVVNQFRVRYDDAYDDNRPDRAEYFYAKCGCFNANGTNPGANAKGPPLPEKSIDYQDISAYLEKRLSKRFSVFANVPVRFINPIFNVNAGGIANVDAGFKYALLNRNGRYLTFQLRIYAPSGNPALGLGNGHVSIEPGLLYWRTLSDRLFIQGELLNWAPVGGSDFAGDILQWGGGVGYVAYRRFDPTARSTRYAGNLPPQVAPQNYFLVTPLLEGVGWTVLGGKEFIPGFIGNTYTPDLNVVRSAAGDTIFNIKLGVRVTKGFNSIYAGWGHALTQEIWYRNIFRLEYRRFF
jgi:hypothetical protein